ncbi:MAG: dipeptidase [Clostridium sp.]
MRYIDMHCDTIARLYKAEHRNENLLKNKGHLDLIRMQEGDCLAQNFALFTELTREEDPYGYCMALSDLFHKEIRDNGDLIRQAVTVDEILQNEKAGKMSAVLTIEEGGVCKGKTENLQRLYDMGARMMTLTWNYENELAFPNKINMTTGESIPDTEHGLKKKGVEFVEMMEDLGMVVDVSHLGDAGFFDVAKILKTPFAASHSNARAIASHTRNLTDEMIHMLADRGGVMGINFCAAFLSDNELGKDVGQSRISDMVAHIQHIKKVGGIECIGLGSDYDGIGGELEMDSPAAFYRLEEELFRQGFSEEEIEKIFYKNVLRLYRDVWK